MVPRGRLVVLEGGEGAGKSTQAVLLAARLGALLTREPGGTALGERLRALLLEPSRPRLAPRAELMLMLAARAEHVEAVLGPALGAGRDVVCDRFSGSTLAYQGYGRGLPLEEVAAACRVAAAGVEPDLTVLLDLPPESGLRRSKAPAGEGVPRALRADRFEAEDLAFHERVRAGYLELARAGGWAVVDASPPVEEVAEQVAEAVERALGTSWAGGRRP